MDAPTRTKSKGSLKKPPRKPTAKRTLAFVTFGNAVTLGMLDAGEDLQWQALGRGLLPCVGERVTVRTTTGKRTECVVDSVFYGHRRGLHLTAR